MTAPRPAADPSSHPPPRRVWTGSLTNGSGQKVPVDLGAGWIHGLTGNPLVALAQQAGVALPSKKTNYDNNQLYLWDGRRASGAQEAA